MNVPSWRKRLCGLSGLPADAPLRIGVVAPGVWRRRRRLGQLLGPGVRLRFGTGRETHAVAGWGLKGQGHQLARQRGLPYLALEDAFLARLGGDEGRFGLLGIIVDPIGIYYDASRPSLLEELIAQAAKEPADPSADELTATIRREGLGKFNTLDPARLRARAERAGSYDAVVVDQIAGDLSIAGGLAEAGDFSRMLEAAFDENPGGRIAVKLHPYDGVGGRTGHLRDMAQRYGAEILPGGTTWVDCARTTRRVYVVSSNAGLEALIAGADVTCFGVPFFAGWGLTDDRQPCSRRTARPNLAQLVGAVYGRYGAYWLPSLARSASALELARFVSAQQRHHKLLGGGLAVSGVPKLKRSHIRPFVPRGAPLLVGKQPRAARGGALRSAAWASRVLTQDGDSRPDVSDGTLLVEDGFLRSSGLGADLVRPASLVFDSRGIYFDPSRPSDIEHLLANEELEADQCRRARALIGAIAAAGISKYNVGTKTAEIDPAGRQVILVPGQVANDASVRLGGGEVRSNRELLAAVRARNENAFIVYKPHPDVEEAGRPGHVPDARNFADEILTGTDPGTAIGLCDEVHTLTSLLGFEALIRGRAVTTYGAPFYAGWGLTTDHAPMPRRGRNRSLEELVYLCLVAYPLYVSPRSYEPCGPEDVVEALTDAAPWHPSIPLARSMLRLWRKLRTAPDYLR